MTIKKITYYELLKVREVERGTGYSKGLEIDEKTIKKSTNIESLIELLEQKYQGDKKEWVLIPKHLIKEIPYRYEEYDFVIVKSELDENEMIEGIDYVGAQK